METLEEEERLGGIEREWDKLAELSAAVCCGRMSRVLSVIDRRETLGLVVGLDTSVTSLRSSSTQSQRRLVFGEDTNESVVLALVEILRLLNMSPWS